MSKTIEIACNNMPNIINKSAESSECRTTNQAMFEKTTMFVKRRRGHKKRKSRWYHRNKFNARKNQKPSKSQTDRFDVIAEIPKGCERSWCNTYHTIIAWQYQRQAAFWKEHSIELERKNASLLNELNNLQNNFKISNQNLKPSLLQTQNKDADICLNENVQELESDIQRNFDLFVQENNPLFWPNIPLNL